MYAAGGEADLYSILELPSTATPQQIKQAYRSKAKLLHPDVNKAADAQERFLECKMAYQAGHLAAGASNHWVGSLLG